MAFDLSRAFRAKNGISLQDELGIFNTAATPVGQSGDIGSLVLRKPAADLGEAWLKRNSGDNDWDQLAPIQGTPVGTAIPFWNVSNKRLEQSANLVWSTGLLINSYVQFQDISAPGAPGSGYGRLYKKTGDDGLFWMPDAAGPEVDLTSGGGGGDVYKVGTPVNNQIGVWTGDGTIEGDSNLTWTGTTLDLNGTITLEDTTASTEGIILKGSSRFIHNFHDPTGGGAVPEGFNLFIGLNSGNFTVGSTAANTWEGSSNVCTGNYSGFNLTTGYFNSCYGRQAGIDLTTGFSNVLSGGNSGANLTTGVANTYVGTDSGRYINGGGDNITTNSSVCLGFGTRLSADGVTNEIVIGRDAIGQGSNTITFGNTNITDTYLRGDVTLEDGHQLITDKVRAIDNDGLSLYNDGDVGIYVHDNGYSGFGTESPEYRITAVGTDLPSSSFQASRYSDNIYGPYYFMRKSRGTEGSPAIVQSGDAIGGLRWMARTATGGSPAGWRYTADIWSWAEGTVSGDSVPGVLNFHVNSGTEVDPSVRMGIHSDGHVGLNEEDPQAWLEINGGDLTVDDSWTDTSITPILAIQAADAYLHIISDDGTNWGSAISFDQVDISEATDLENRWVLARQTNGDGSGDGSFNFLYGTNQSLISNSIVLKIKTNGDLVPYGNIDLTEGSNILVDATPATDHSASGEIIYMTNGNVGSVAAGDVCYVAADGDLEFADADSDTTMPGLYMAIETIAGGSAGYWLRSGFARDDTWAWTPGQPVYVSTNGTTGNTLTQTAPTGSGDQVQIVGVATHADRIDFRPSQVIVELA